MYLACVFLPLIAAFISGFFGRIIGDRAAQIVTSSALVISFFISLLILNDVAFEGNVYQVQLLTWISSGSFEVSWALQFDSLTAVMVFVVTIVSSVVHIYSIGYMAHDAHIPRFMAYLSLFTFSMLLLVTSSNFIQLFFGWEGVGLCSYLLIGFWYTRPAANAAAIKAFLVNRVGDFGFALGILAIFLTFGSMEFDKIFSTAPQLVGHSSIFLGAEVDTLTLICLLLFFGAMGKSAQIGLHTWLPDAMEGPTPVSALIHAATMVTAGVFLVVRCSPLFELSDTALIVVTLVGASTAFMAATIGLVQNDIKRVIAYSTCSQLGYMFFACGVSAYSAAIFHLMTHSFFKALLFLGAGSVIHAMSDEQDMRKMGALRLAMPITAATFIVGWLAIAGVPPFSGFWSKDEILLAAWEQHNIGPLLWGVGLVTALLTAYYMSRQVILVFFGEQRWDEEAHPHESSWTMTAPLCVLAGAAAVGGVINLPLVKDWLVLEHFLEPIFNDPHHFSSGTLTKIALAVISVAAGIVGIFFAVMTWLTKRIPNDRLEPDFLENAMYIDATYARVVGGVGTSGFQGTANVDERFVDGAVNGIGKLILKTGQLIRPAQSGYIRNYAVGVAVGALAIIVLLTWGLLR